MKKILIKGIALALAVVLSLSTAAFGAAAELEERTPLKLQLPEAVAGVEFQMECSDGLSFQALEKSNDLSQASLTPVVEKDGVFHFGFYSGDNRYAAGELDLGDLLYTGSGTVRITQARTVRVIDRDTTDATVYPLDITFHVPGGTDAGVEIDLTSDETEKPGTGSEGSGGGSGSSGSTSGGSGNAGTVTNQELPFADVAKTAWYYEAVEYVFGNELMNGTSGTMFTPNRGTTRAMVVTTLWRMESEPLATSDCSFTDLTQTWYQEAVAWAAEEGIVNGYSAASFGPDDLVTREQLAAILHRYAAYENKDVTERLDLASYVDADKIASWAEASMEWACAVGLITGKTGGRLDPKGYGTRAELATLLQRYAELPQ